MNIGDFVVVNDEQAFTAALKLCRGDYQRNLVRGFEALSGSTLRGSARDWSIRYAQSRDALLSRLRAADIPFRKERQGRRVVLVIGD